VSTTPEPADHRDERPETEGPLTEANHWANTRTTLGTMTPSPAATAASRRLGEVTSSSGTSC
jgi:hypothetical protein